MEGRHAGFSCHGRVQAMPAGGATTLRSNIRNWTSNLCRSVLYIVRPPAAQTATGETTASKYRTGFLIEAFFGYRQKLNLVILCVLTIGIEHTDSKQQFFEPSDVHPSLRCALYNHGFTRDACVKAPARSCQR